jgi:hypothetical protein
MAVITNAHDDCRGNSAIFDERCSICKEKLMQYPFIRWWAGGDDVFFCAVCSARIRDGMMADLVQIAAIVEIQRIAPHYKNSTLVREHIPELEQRLEKKDEEFQRRILKENEKALRVVKP